MDYLYRIWLCKDGKRMFSVLAADNAEADRITHRFCSKFKYLTAEREMIYEQDT